MKIHNFKKCIFLIVILTILECCLVGYIGVWREGFWNAVQQKNLHEFLIKIFTFSLVAGGACLVSGYSQYLQQYASLIRRYHLTKKARNVINRSQYDTEGQSQRVQEDCFSYPQLMISLSTGVFKNSIILIVYMTILATQLGAIYLIFPFIYAIVGTAVAAKLAGPLINLNYMNQVLEARFRQVLSKINYARVHRNNSNMFIATKKLSYFQYFYNQITVIVPYIVLSPLYFSSKILFGVFMQCSSSMIEIITCLSYLINSFNDINRWLSCRKRLKELGAIK